MNKAIIVDTGEDWDGLYIDGNLITQGHSINLRDVLGHFGYGLEYLDADEKYAMYGEQLPDLLEDVSLDTACGKEEA